jgi:hypothetical protein
MQFLDEIIARCEVERMDRTPSPPEMDAPPHYPAR